MGAAIRGHLLLCVFYEIIQIMFHTLKIKCVLSVFRRLINVFCVSLDFTHRWLVVCYQRFDTIYPFHFKNQTVEEECREHLHLTGILLGVFGSLKMGPTACPETSLKYYLSALSAIPWGRISFLKTL